MRRETIALLVAGLYAGGAFAQTPGEAETSGSVSIGVRSTAANANDPSKLNEYRDLDSGVNAGIELRRRTDTDYLNIYGENIGRDDQYLNLSGGRFGEYKFRFYMDDMRHNFGSGPGAMTPYVGAGSANLVGTLPNSNIGSWQQFDNSIKRRDVGGMFELQKASPWYTRVEYNEVTRKGTGLIAGANGTSPGNGFMDLPAPIDYTTKNFFGEGGYAGKNSHFAGNVLYSKFDNGFDTLRWQNGFFGGLDSTVLPPDNQMWRLGANGNVRRLFMDSTLAARLTYSRVYNNVTVLQNMLSTGATNPATNPNDGSFVGDVRTTTLGLSLASHPIDRLDTKLYYNYYNQSNDSSEMTFNPAVNSGLRAGSTNPAVNCANVAGVLCSAELFHLKKQNLGVDAGYRLNRENKLMGGLDYTKADRNRVDFPETNENRYYGEWKNSSIDWLTGRVRYQRLNRHSTFDDTAFSAFAGNPMDLYVRRFDLANVHQDLFKFVFDLTPLPLTDFGFEAIYKKNKYNQTILGRTEDRRQEFYVSAGYGDPKALRGFMFGDIEYTRYDSTHRNDGSGTGNPDPSTPPTASVYNWTAENRDKAWQVGAGVDWSPVTQLKVKASAIYASTNGTTDFTLQQGVPASVVRPVNIDNFDNTRRTTFNLRGIYDLSREWELSAGYAFERYRYSDIGYNNTAYVTSANNQAGSVSGQYSFQPYTANIWYATAKYRF